MTPDQRRASAWTPLADLAKLNETSVDMVKACLHAAGIEPMAITHDKGIEDMAPYGKAMDAIASHRGKFTPAMSTDEVVRKVVAKLIPELSSTIRILLGDATGVAREAGQKAQRVVDTVITQAENIVGMQRNTNERVQILGDLVKGLTASNIALIRALEADKADRARADLGPILPIPARAKKVAPTKVPKPAPAKKVAAKPKPKPRR